jgi:hypothetical protein
VLLLCGVPLLIGFLRWNYSDLKQFPAEKTEMITYFGLNGEVSCSNSPVCKVDAAIDLGGGLYTYDFIEHFPKPPGGLLPK